MQYETDGSPYRATEPLAPAIPIAHKHGSWVFDGVLGALAIAAMVTLFSGLHAIAASIGFWVALFGAIRLVERFGLHGAHRIDADERGIRLRCSQAALAQMLSIVNPRQVDLFIPWEECLSIDARPHQFGGDIEMALVITTPNGLIAVRPIFSTDPMRIALRLHDVRRQLAAPPDDDRLA